MNKVSIPVPCSLQDGTKWKTFKCKYYFVSIILYPKQVLRELKVFYFLRVHLKDTSKLSDNILWIPRCTFSHLTLWNPGNFPITNAQAAAIEGLVNEEAGTYKFKPAERILSVQKNIWRKTVEHSFKKCYFCRFLHLKPI